jgi:flagellar motor protein MotB
MIPPAAPTAPGETPVRKRTFYEKLFRVKYGYWPPSKQDQAEPVIPEAIPPPPVMRRQNAMRPPMIPEQPETQAEAIIEQKEEQVEQQVQQVLQNETVLEQKADETQALLQRIDQVLQRLEQEFLSKQMPANPAGAPTAPPMPQV